METDARRGVEGMRLAERAFGESSRELLVPQNMMGQSEDTVTKMDGAGVTGAASSFRVSARECQRGRVVAPATACRPQPP